MNITIVLTFLKFKQLNIQGCNKFRNLVKTEQRPTVIKSL